MQNKYIGADLAGRLHGTVVRYRGNAFFCAVDGPEIELRTLTNDRVYARIRPEDPDLDISSLPLGFVNYSRERTVVHIRREPVRRYKQGVDPQAMTYVNLNPKKLVRGEVFKDQGFQENIANKYPNFEQALKMITSSRDNWDSIALSRDVALLKDAGTIKVFISTDEVGFIRLASGTNNNECNIRKTDVSFVIRSKLGNLGIIVREGL